MGSQCPWSHRTGLGSDRQESTGPRGLGWGVGGASGDEVGMTFRICRALSAGGGPCIVPSLVCLSLWPTWQL